MGASLEQAPVGGAAPRRPRGRRRLSLLRVGTALVATAGLAVGATTVVGDAIQALEPSPGDPWFAPYVDVTLTPQFHFEDPTDSPSSDAVLGFVVAGDDGACTPTWGTHYDLDEAATTLDLDRRIARLRQRSGDVVVSFGGAINNELALRCEDVADLAGAYREVVERYELTTVDFDIEGAAMSDTAANRRRAEAAKQLQDEAHEAGRPLAVWLTLPVAPQGLPAEAVGVVDAMLAAGVDLAGVNVMTMNYAGSRPAGTTMFDATVEALESTWRQLSSAYRRAGVPLADGYVWRKVGATPMIGQNDALADRFSLDDASKLRSFASRHGLGRVSMWSANRDGPCGAQWAVERVSNTCSGVDQQPLEFTAAFGELGGRAQAAADVRTVPDTSPVAVDDPATSPYPVWRAQRVYEEGKKVVWHGNVYVAKWWTQGDLPDEPVVNVWDTPWRYVGPVLPSDVPRTVEPVATGDYPAWSPDEVYGKGDRVTSDGAAYVAKWWTRGERPDDDADRPWDTPWELADDR
ncbi:MAG: glycosyl hydrolase family 18 [Acidimicrobiia bacterium]|nr:glycosyl hydrolase family 18 [Acidimicrobiia bacterium]